MQLFVWTQTTISFMRLPKAKTGQRILLDRRTVLWLSAPILQGHVHQLEDCWLLINRAKEHSLSQVEHSIHTHTRKSHVHWNRHALTPLLLIFRFFCAWKHVNHILAKNFRADMHLSPSVAPFKHVRWTHLKAQFPEEQIYSFMHRPPLIGFHNGWQIYE